MLPQHHQPLRLNKSICLKQGKNTRRSLVVSVDGVELRHADETPARLQLYIVQSGSKLSVNQGLSVSCSHRENVPVLVVQNDQQERPLCRVPLETDWRAHSVSSMRSAEPRR